jgi:hypothetical protein
MSSTASFLRRWSQRKLEGAIQPAAAAPEVAQPVVPLPAIESLDFDADFSAFMQQGVDGEMRRHALRKLFLSDHYRVMDGLDVYIDDYSKPALLAPELLQTLEHAHTLLQKTEEAVAEAAVLVPPEDPKQA